MNKALQKMTEEWKKLERMTLEQRKNADAFYDNHLMQLIQDDYVKRNRSKAKEKVKYLVVSVGTSYEPIVLNIALFRPEKILLLYTEKTEACMEKIVQYSNLSIAACYKSRVSETDPLTIYQEIKQAYVKWKKPEKMYIDFTGGTKAMSAAAAMAGAMIDVQLIYVGTNDYLTDFRKPNPGSETLFYIDNPLAVFGDLEIEKAFQLFGQYNFAGAGAKLETLQENIPDPGIRQQLHFAYLLAKTYEYWDALDFVSAYQTISRLCKEIARDKMHKDFLLIDLKDELDSQKEILKQLQEIPEQIAEKKNFEVLKTDSRIHALIFTMYQNATARTHQGKLDMATLLLYRLLEMMAQRRLALYNLYISGMDYSAICYEMDYNQKYAEADPAQRFELLKEDVFNIKKELFRKPGNSYLPDQVSLLEGFIILHAFHDPIVYKSEKDGLNVLKRIRSMVFLRNNSIFAHGLGPVSETDFQKFRKFVEELFIEFCRIEQIPFYQYAKKMQWIDPAKSVNYSSVLGGAESWQ